MRAERGSTTMGRLPPTLFMTKRKRPMQEECTDTDEISTMTVKSMANHVSAQK